MKHALTLATLLLAQFATAYAAKPGSDKTKLDITCKTTVQGPLRLDQRELRSQVLKSQRGTAKSEHVQLLDKTIAAIQASTALPTLVDMKDFKAGPNRAN
jgi:hypothetical protein